MEKTYYTYKNKPLTDEVEAIVNQLSDENERVLFVIIGDLTLKSRYAPSALIFTERLVVSYEEGHTKRFLFSDMKNVEAKRMYGNATLSALMPDGRREIFYRYNYSIASLCDAAALFINHINAGADLNEELAIIAVSFERILSVCPKCGRTLLHPGAQCIMCRSKTKILKSLS
ncbi:MAG: hypothetical protein IJD67_07135, partial [Clostridia bacterium]|nr:hypothetical protein [Clostridia bacterium]